MSLSAELVSKLSSADYPIPIDSITTFFPPFIMVQSLCNRKSVRKLLAMRGLSQGFIPDLIHFTQHFASVFQAMIEIPGYKTDCVLLNLTLRSKSSIIIQKFLFTADVLTSVDPGCL